MSDLPILYFPATSLWRSWLRKNHRTSTGIWFIFFKKQTGQPSLTYDDAVEEALCFGWIDSIRKRIDAERYVHKFTPRKKRSVWSEPNKRRVRMLIREGRMTDAGLALVNEAKRDGSWKTVPASRTTYAFTPELLRLLESNIKAHRFYNELTDSQRGLFLGWIMSAKKEETRIRRMKEAIGFLERGKKLGMK